MVTETKPEVAGQPGENPPSRSNVTRADPQMRLEEHIRSGGKQL
jgi:hypothetical protein